MSGESKQIDEDENGPENGGMKSGPCLIAGFHALSCTSPSYYNPYRGCNKNTLSVDMVRLSLTFKGDRGEWLSRKGAQLTDCDEMSAWTSKIRPGGWYELWSFALEELRSRISRPLEYLMRREQPRQQSLNDVLRDAQRAADAWNRDHAAPQRTYRGRAR